MKKSKVGIIGLVAIVLIVCAAAVGIWMVSANNNMTRASESAKSKWGNVEADYQHRKDLVSQAINIVKGAGNYEQETLEKVIQARNNTVELNKDDLTEENIAKFQASYDKMAQEMTRAINVTVERYPELTATKNYQEFQVQIEGCENRINVSRKQFNAEVEKYNKMIKVFPNSIVANMFGHEEMGYFKAAEGADEAPSTEILL
ncbi:MAG: LemA family protein [Bacteroidales bacterium]|nr:LemA family protein [Bacteroidales bacterium]